MVAREKRNNRHQPAGLAAALGNFMRLCSRSRKEQQQQIVPLHQQHPGKQGDTGALWQCFGCSAAKSNKSSFAGPLAAACLMAPAIPVMSKNTSIQQACQQQQQHLVAPLGSELSFLSPPSTVVTKLSSCDEPWGSQWRDKGSPTVSELLRAIEQATYPGDNNEAQQIAGSIPTCSNHFESSHPSVIAEEKAADASWREFMAWRLTWMDAAVRHQFPVNEAGLQLHEVELMQRLQKGSATTCCASVQGVSSHSGGTMSPAGESLHKAAAFTGAGNEWEMFVESPELRAHSITRARRKAVTSITSSQDLG